MNFLAAGPLEMRSLLFQTYAECGDCGEAFIIRCMGPLAANGQTRGIYMPSKKCVRSAKAPQIGDGTIFPRPSLKCYAEIRVNVRCAASTRQTPHLDSRCARSLPSLSPQPGVHPRPPSPPAENVLPSLPFLPSVVGPSNKRPKSTSLSALKK